MSRDVNILGGKKTQTNFIFRNKFTCCLNKFFILYGHNVREPVNAIAERSQQFMCTKSVR